ncbi:putative pro-neuregulin-3 [Triplophysa rosa]|uniref:Pro-neuregulin-3 n=1 Tax=Triplophysa rosa TaxID=992332 RepID=A0A9W8C124_TRIRA|nr:putative pro-neuregulin-3 [Triplophysa rosa]
MRTRGTKRASPTLPPLKSEHFKPCQEKDLAYCLNDGECFVIETLSGPHKHCSAEPVSLRCQSSTAPIPPVSTSPPGAETRAETSGKPPANITEADGHRHTG